MFKKWSALLLVVLLIVPLTLTACGGDDDKDDSADDIKLTQTFTDEATGVTVQYPEGWAVRSDTSGMGGIVAANSQAALDSDTLVEGQLGVIIIAFPLEAIGATELDAAFTQFNAAMMGGDESINASAVTDITIGDVPARRMTVLNPDTGDVVVIGWLSGTNLMVAMGTVPAGGQLADVEPTMRAMAETIQVNDD